MLFKILHGDASRISTDITPFHEGYCYVTYDGSMYVDMNLGTETAPNNKRVQLNAKDALTSIEAQALINQNNGEKVQLWVGTQAELDAIEERDANCVYFTTDEIDFDPNDVLLMTEQSLTYQQQQQVMNNIGVTQRFDEVDNAVSNVYNDFGNSLNNLREDLTPDIQTITLPSSGWNIETLQQTITVTGISADQSAQIITISPDTSCYTEYLDAEVQCIGQADNSLTFSVEEIPSSDFTVYVAVQNCK